MFAASSGACSFSAWVFTEPFLRWRAVNDELGCRRGAHRYARRWLAGGHYTRRCSLLRRPGTWSTAAAAVLCSVLPLASFPFLPTGGAERLQRRRYRHPVLACNTRPMRWKAKVSSVAGSHVTTVIVSPSVPCRLVHLLLQITSSLRTNNCFYCERGGKTTARVSPPHADDSGAYFSLLAACSFIHVWAVGIVQLCVPTG